MRMLSELALLACLASTLFMSGVIAFVQVVHYPLFGEVEAASFRAYHAAHVRRTTYVVIVPMVVELVTSLVLVVSPPPGSGRPSAGLGLAAVAVTWLATAMLSVPLHDRLAGGFDRDAHRTLVSTNGVRLVAWFVHAGVLLAMTARATH